MTTLSTPTLNELAWEWDNNCGYASAVLSGIVGDPAHAASGGYHISIEDQVNPNNYSVVRPKDKAPPGTWPRNRAAAIDMSMNTSDMVKCWNRVFAVWQNRANDPRAKYFNAFNGWNGTGKAERLDFITGSRSITTDDHKWHCHDETCRCYVNDLEMKKAKLSVFRGESVDQYRGTSVSVSRPQKEEEMAKLFWKKGASAWAMVGMAPGTDGNCYLIDTQEEANSTLAGLGQSESIKVFPDKWEHFIAQMRAPLNQAPEA
jgi:hypothetical protein